MTYTQYLVSINTELFHAAYKNIMTNSMIFRNDHTLKYFALEIYFFALLNSYNTSMKEIIINFNLLNGSTTPSRLLASCPQFSLIMLLSGVLTCI